MDDRVMKPITEFCSINMGQSPDSKTYNEKGEGIPFYQGNADFGEIHPKTRVWCSKPVKIADKDDILISVRAPIGAMNIATEKCCIGRGLASITPNDDRCNSQYLFYALKSKTESLMMQGTGSTFKAISRKVLENTQIPEYSEEEQKFIVEAMSSVEKALRIKKEELDNLEQLVKARFVEMFGDPVANDKGWETMSFKNMGECKNGMNFHYDEEGVEIHCLGVGDFKDYSIISKPNQLPQISLDAMPTEDYLLRDGDIVFVRSNGNKALVGRSVAVYPGNVPTTFSGFCIRFRKNCEKVQVPYLLRVLKTESMRKKMTGRGANIQNLNQQILSSLVIPVPPIELQQQFADFVEQVEKVKQVIKEQLEELETLKKSLMQKYFG